MVILPKKRLGNWRKKLASQQMERAAGEETLAFCESTWQQQVNTGKSMNQQATEGNQAFQLHLTLASISAI